MKKVLVLKFCGKQQSYGVFSNTGYRESQELPTKSSIVGLILNAFGHDKYSFSLEDKIDIDDEFINKYSHVELANIISNCIRIAVRDDSYNYGKYIGNKYTDYQTAKYYRTDGMKNVKRNEVQHKEYLSNRRFLVLIEGEEKLLDVIQKTLLNPKRNTLYFGKKSCITDGFNLLYILNSNNENREGAIVEGTLESVLCDEKYDLSKNGKYSERIPLFDRNHMIELENDSNDFSEYKRRIGKLLHRTEDDVTVSIEKLRNADMIKVEPCVYRDFIYYRVYIKKENTIRKQEQEQEDNDDNFVFNETNLEEIS